MAQRLNPYNRLCKGLDIHDPSIHVPRPSHMYCDPASAQYVEIDGGCKLFYRVFGKGPRKMMMVMAFAATHMQWEPQFLHFGIEHGDEFSVCVFDNRGIGFSGEPPGRWRTTDLANDVWCIVEKLRWDRVHLIGLSMGGMISLEAALLRPDLVASLTLISTHGGGLGTIPPLSGAMNMVKIFSQINKEKQDTTDVALDIMFPTSFLDKPSLAPPLEEWAPATQRFQLGRSMVLRGRLYVESTLQIRKAKDRAKGVAKQFSAIITHYISWRRLEHLRNVGFPILVCSGELDNLIAPWNSRMLSQALQAKHVHFDDAGHCCNEQYPGEVNAAILEIMNHGDKRPMHVVNPMGPSWHPGLLWAVIVTHLASIACIFCQEGSVGKRYWLALGAFVAVCRRLS